MSAKSTVVKPKTIQLLEQKEIYQFPEDQQTNTHHPLLFNLTVVKGVVKSLKTRNKFRTVTITLTDGELKDSYMDEEGNIAFNEYYLETVPESGAQNIIAPNATNKSLHSIAKEAVLDKFDGKNSNAETWLKTFVLECTRLNVDQQRYAEMLRLFLDGMASEWYATFVMTHKLTDAWDLWNNSFLDTFNERSWADIAYAYTFKYLQGDILEFALKKRRLLLVADPTSTVTTQINLIVTSLPNLIRTRLHKNDINSIDNLMSALRQLGQIVNKNKKTEDKSNESKPSYKPCKHCERTGFPNRFHPENVCRTKLNNEKKSNNDRIKVVNNTELETMVAQIEEAKN